MVEKMLRVLVPGTLCDARIFDPMRIHWINSNPTVALNLADLDTPAQWWNKQLASLPQRFDLVGFSLGGILAMALIHLFPDRVRRLVLIASNADAAGPMQQSRSAQQLAQFHSQGPQALITTMLRDPQLGAGLSQEAVQLLQDMAERTTLRQLSAQADLNANRASGHEALRSWDGPLMLVYGDKDPWCGPAVQFKILATRPDAHVYAVAGASHYLSLERPAEVAHSIDLFLHS